LSRLSAKTTGAAPPTSLMACQWEREMPEISRFFGIVIRMYYDDHNPPHLHAEHQGNRVLVDFRGNIVQGELRSRTALRLVREWTDLHAAELQEDWRLARAGEQLNKIDPLD
jgi:hypothetical protein